MATTLDEELETRSVQQDIADALALIERANARLRPGELTRSQARSLIDAYGRIMKLLGFGVASLSPGVGDASVVARASGTSMGRAREAVATGTTIESSPELDAAMRQGAVSLEQAGEITRAEQAAPGSAKTLVKVAQDEAFHVLKDRARKLKLEAKQHRDLAERQHQARRASSHVDERVRFEHHLADAYAQLLAGGTGKGHARRPELTVLVSHSVAKRGWIDVRPGELCKIPGLGPVAPRVAREIASNAFLNGVFFDGKDLRNFKRWSRDIPVDVRAALELGPPPTFNGIRCRDCGNHFRTEWDHVHPRVAHGPASTTNLEARCWSCHKAKTARDRRAGKLRPP